MRRAELRVGRRRRGAATVFDASAILAVVNDEPGGEEVARRMEEPSSESVVGAVNLSEVVAKLSERGVPPAGIREAMSGFGLFVVPFDEELAYEAGELRPETRSRGLSFGDRACVALARMEGVAALTMERSWDGLEGVEVIERPENE